MYLLVYNIHPMQSYIRIIIFTMYFILSLSFLFLSLSLSTCRIKCIGTHIFCIWLNNKRCLRSSLSMSSMQRKVNSKHYDENIMKRQKSKVSSIFAGMIFNHAQLIHMDSCWKDFCCFWWSFIKNFVNTETHHYLWTTFQCLHLDRNIQVFYQVFAIFVQLNFLQGHANYDYVSIIINRILDGLL